MSKTISLVLAFQLFLILGLQSQNFTSSPYSRLGLGEMRNEGTSYNRSIGNAGIALRKNNQINYLNPASYTAFDTLSFLFSGGLSGRYARVFNEEAEDHVHNFNMEYINIGFPVFKQFKMSLGLQPFSRMSYRYHEYIIPPDTVDAVLFEYLGDGGLNEFYFGGAVLIGDFLSVGVNATYLFGTLERQNTLSIPGITAAQKQESTKYQVSDFYFRTGLQFFREFNEKHHVVFGLTYDFTSDIKVNVSELKFREFPFISAGSIVDTFRIISDSAGSFELPSRTGVGLTYTFDDKIMITAEYITQNWTNTNILGTDLSLTKYSGIRVGLEYTPVALTKRVRAGYLKRISYRAGFYHSNTYWNVEYQQDQFEQISDYGFSIGLGLPWINSKKLYTSTVFNLTYQIGWRGTTNNGLLQENYHNFTIGFTLHDYWFIKPKYD